MRELALSIRVCLTVVGLLGALALGIIAYTAIRGHLPSVGGESFHDGFSATELSHDAWELDADEDCVLVTTSDPAADGKVLKIEAPAGGRCELLPVLRENLLGKLGHEPRHRPLSYSFNTYIPGGQSFGDKNEVLAQWHSHPDQFLGDPRIRGPALALRIESGREFISGAWDDDFVSGPGRRDKTLWEGPVSLNEWTSWRFEVYWSFGDDGWVKVWRDDVLILDLQGPNTFNDLRNVYLKLGVYHPVARRIVYFDEFRFNAL